MKNVPLLKGEIQFASEFKDFERDNS